MFNSQTNNIENQKESLVTAAVILICLVLSVFFPSDNSVQGMTKALFFFFVIPVLYIKFVLKKNVSDFGLNLRNRKTGFFWGALMLAVSLGLSFFLVKSESFMNNYRISSLMVNNFWIFTVNMLIFSNLLLFFQEYFFRGFMLSFMREKIGFWSVPFQVAIYFLIVVISQKGFSENLWQMAPPAILSVTGGITAYKSKSIVYSWISGLIFLILFGAYIILTVKTK